MRKSDIDEILAQLYLRLNGYFTTGLILHSPEWGQARTEIDCLAIRHPYHCQSERGVETSDFLGTHEGETDVILCEVKNNPSSLIFNRPMREDIEALRATLRWAGIFTETQTCSVAERLQSLLHEDARPEVVQVGVVEGTFRVRPLLCCPPCFEPVTDKWCLLGTEILQFADKCFNPQNKRDLCSTRYNFHQWGYPLTPIVQYLKNCHRMDTPSLEGLYQKLESYN